MDKKAFTAIKNENRILMALYAFFSVLRIWLGSMVGIWYSGAQSFDDVLMINYSEFPTYFKSMYAKEVMLKEISMPFFYQLVNLSGISYPAVISILWIINGGLIAYIVYQISRKKLLSFFMFLLTVFTPSAFEMFCGTRLYRAGLLNPMYLTVFALSLIMIIKAGEDADKKHLRNRLILSAVLGVIFSFTYYIKEDGIWILAVLIACSLVGIVSVIIKNAGEKAKEKMFVSILCFIIPFFVFIISTTAYKGVNYCFFNVFETNIRTGGESGKFVENVYKIASDERSNSVWAPKDAIEKAFQVSPTLSSHPELKEEIYTSAWVDGNIDAKPIQGDFLTWVLKDAVFDCNVVNTPSEKEEFFKKVNAELDSAFKDGRLQKEKNRFQAVSSVGGKTGEEYKNIAKSAFRVYSYHVLLKDYEYGVMLNTANAPQSNEMLASVIVNYNLMPLSDPSSLNRRNSELAISKPFLGLINIIYKIVYPLTIFAAFAGIVSELIRFVKEKNKKEEAKSALLALTAVGFLGVSYCYGFMIMLFCTQYTESFPMAEKMYSVGEVPVLMIFSVIGISLLVRNLFKKEQVEKGE